MPNKRMATTREANLNGNPLAEQHPCKELLLLATLKDPGIKDDITDTVLAGALF